MKNCILILITFLTVCAFGQDLKIVRPRIVKGKTIEREVCVYHKPKNWTTQSKDKDGNPITVSHFKASVTEKKKVTRQKVCFIFFLYNSGKKTIKIPTARLDKSFFQGDRKLIGKLKDDSRFTGALCTMPRDTSLLILGNGQMYCAGDKSKGIPRFPVIIPRSSFKIVELRPGEGCYITCEKELKSLENGDKFIIQYNPDNLDGRYDFWKGSVISEPFSYKTTKSLMKTKK